MKSGKLLIFGGTGFVGSVVVRKALQRGWRVICATRGGVPIHGSPLYNEFTSLQQKHGDTFSQGVAHDTCHVPQPLEFVSLDATSRLQVFQFMDDHPDASAIISCIGLLTRDHEMARRVCGDANVNIAAALYERRAVARRMVLISAEPVGTRAGFFLNSRWALKGYFMGKRIAERAVLENLGDDGAVLRPGFIYGTRHVPLGEGCVPVPLWPIGKPLEAVLRPLHLHGLLVPPISVDVVAEAAVRLAEAPGPSTVLDYYGMQQVCGLPQDGHHVLGEDKTNKEECGDNNQSNK
ncbi:hypothetical protein, conserved [Trypanosoma brucei gambiense DAL972]|uniref:NAD-dependent epimerase/dehydratase domain-containing protein n=1 Tax=Trypanosoma brucei gambiense (strain MHOM/CI/86/DAL972) TaxID=679716 RepID=C9ZT51_TRYB9|nr:hypothetical protein, conserved [Trypanosoma brucei gambiense DAL972]CBH12586.1 hypothetical protein, conserved [Trypanosoma brucei gambiense DAL972]|eukprot:XP_011774866.1 hypothetical protein, conserved [Trypanosoma brucei gambiense DAL972]